MLKNGQTNVKNAERSGRPSTSTTDEKQEEAIAIIIADRELAKKELCYNQASVAVRSIL